MEVLQLQYFLAAAERENISAAAKTFMVPPSSVSASIKKLEKELGTALFKRSANSLRLSENGKIFQKGVENAAAALQNARREMEARMGRVSGEIHLLILTNRSLVTERISSFKKKYPAVSFRMQHADPEAGRFDIVISDKPIPGGGFSARSLVREELFLAVHRENPLAGRQSIPLRRMAEENFICMPRGSSLRDNMDAVFHRAGLSPQCVIECDDPYYICEYVKMGLGVTLFPGVSWKRQADENIRLLRVGDGLFRESFLYVGAEVSPAARLFAETLGEV